MYLHPSVELSLAETAAAGGPIPDRARSLLAVLRRAIAFDGAWLAVADPTGPGYHPVASVGVDPDVVGLLPAPAAGELSAWADRPMPAGSDEAHVVALCAPDGRHVGLLALLFTRRRSVSPDVRQRLRRLAPTLAQGVDPMRSIAAAAGLVRGATAGVVLCADGSCEPLPGLADDDLLDPGSPVLVSSRESVGAGHPYASFLWPLTGRRVPDAHVRVTVIAAPEDVPPGLTAVALLSPATGLRGLTARELEVLGLLVEGYANREIARTLVVTPRTVATHLEHVLVKLDAPTRTLAAVRAERDGLYVPVLAMGQPGVGHGRVRPQLVGHPADGEVQPATV